MSNTNPRIRILQREDCPKLTERGQGTLSHELGVNETTGEYFIRIAANSQGGTCSFEWISLQAVEELLANVGEGSFSAVIFRKLFVSRSTNNHGFLAAILKAVKVVGADSDRPTKLTLLSFEPLKEQLNHLKTEDADLPDLVAADIEKREARKQQRLKVTVEQPKKKVRSKKTD